MTQIDFQAAYNIKLRQTRKLTLMADVFNLFDQQTVLNYDTWTALTLRRPRRTRTSASRRRRSPNICRAADSGASTDPIRRALHVLEVSLIRKEDDSIRRPGRNAALRHEAGCKCASSINDPVTRSRRPEERQRTAISP